MGGGCRLLLVHHISRVSIVSVVLLGGRCGASLGWRRHNLAPVTEVGVLEVKDVYRLIRGSRNVYRDLNIIALSAETK